MQSVDIGDRRINYKINPISLANFVLGTCLGVVTCDVLTPFLARIGVIGMLLSTLLVLTFVACALAAFFLLASEVLRGRAIITFLTILALTALNFIQTTNPASLSEELTQEVACMHQHLSFTPDLGFQQGCLFQYPARQFILPAVASLLFGKTLFALNFGGALITAAGLIIFALGLYRCLAATFSADAMGATLIVALSHAPWVLHLRYLYEQSVFPLAFTMAGVGFWLGLNDRPELRRALILLCAVQLAHSYTSGLAPAGLALAVLAYDFRQFRSSNAAIAFLAASASIALSFIYRGDVRLIVDGTQVGLAMRDAWQGASSLLLDSLHSRALHSLATLLYFLGFIAAVSGALSFEGLIIAAWVVITLLIGSGTHGYSNNDVFFRLHRVVVVLPVMLALSAISMRSVLPNLSRRALFGFYCFFFTTGAYFEYSFLTERSVNQHLAWYDWAKVQIESNEAQIFFPASVSMQYASTNDILRYFNPGWHVAILSTECRMPEQPDDRRTLPTYFMLPMFERESCQSSLGRTLEVIAVKPFEFRDEASLYLFKLSASPLV